MTEEGTELITHHSFTITSTWWEIVVTAMLLFLVAFLLVAAFLRMIKWLRKEN